MESQEFLKSLISCKTLNQEYLKQSTAISIGVWSNPIDNIYSKIVTVEFEHTDGERFWSDENILGCDLVIVLSLKT